MPLKYKCIECGHICEGSELIDGHARCGSDKLCPKCHSDQIHLISDFDMMYLNEPKLDTFNPEDEIAMEYHWLTENFDRGICSHFRPNGIAIPTNDHESVLCSRNAKSVRLELAAHYHIPLDLLDKAIKRTVDRFEKEFARKYHSGEIPRQKPMEGM